MTALLLAALGLSCGLPSRAAAPTHVFAIVAARTGNAARGREELAATIEEALRDPEIRGGIQAVIVMSLRSGEVWFERQADTLMMPASNQKLLTSAAALHLLGPDYRFETQLLAKTADLRSDRIVGDLVLKGGGDPFLDDDGLKALAAALRARGIREIQGSVVGDPSAFAEQGYGDGWAWDDMPYYYSVPVSGLNLNSNVRRVAVRPGPSVGAPARVTPLPTARYGQVVNKVVTGARGVTPRVAVDRRLGTDIVTLTGHVPVDLKPDALKPIPVAVENPALYAATRMTEMLGAAGITVRKPARVSKSGHGPMTVLAVFRGAPLREVVARLNKPSDNLAAECLLRTLGRTRRAAGSVASGSAAALKWFADIGMDTRGIIMADGSGLSRQNYLTARNLVTLLQHLHSHPARDAFLQSLPVAGVDGTLRNRMKGTRAEGNCKAKTGYVSRVSSLSGYVTTASGEPLTFSILMNAHPCRNAGATAVQDRIVAALAAYTE